ncbi:hypothetical protein Tco_0562240, partial [Tanacetum coccineum]
YYLVFEKSDARSTWAWKRKCQVSLEIGCNLVIQIFSPSVSMAQLKYCDKHNQVGFLLKPTESAGYTEIVDFLRRSKLRYALTHNPPIYDSLVKQFWQTATARTLADGTQQLNATIDTIEHTITEESVRRQLQLADASGIHMLQNEEIFEGLQNIGSKSGGWDQFGSNIAIALICLSTGRDFNFSKLIFDGMISNLKSKSKFLMYPPTTPPTQPVQTTTPPTQPVQTTSPPPVSTIPDIQPTLPPSPQIPSLLNRIPRSKFAADRESQKIEKKLRKKKRIKEKIHLLLWEKSKGSGEAQEEQSSLQLSGCTDLNNCSTSEVNTGEAERAQRRKRKGCQWTGRGLQAVVQASKT